jgi:hypothetical protein
MPLVSPKMGIAVLLGLQDVCGQGRLDAFGGMIK